MDDNKPYLDDKGDLVIPFACAENEYKYWKQEGRNIEELLKELNAPVEVLARYSFDDIDQEESKG